MQHSYSNGNGAAARPLREKVEFPINVPVAVMLDYDDGELTSGRYGDQYMYSFDGHAKIAWLDIPVRDAIKRTGAIAGDTIAICRREIKGERGKKRVQWEVERAEEEPAQPDPPPPAPPPPAPAQAKPAARATTTTPQPAPALPENPLALALILAIDACELAHKHAATAHAWDDWSFTDDAIVRLAITAFIQASGGKQRP